MRVYSGQNAFPIVSITVLSSETNFLCSASHYPSQIMLTGFFFARFVDVLIDVLSKTRISFTDYDLHANLSRSGQIKLASGMLRFPSRFSSFRISDDL